MLHKNSVNISEGFEQVERVENLHLNYLLHRSFQITQPFLRWENGFSFLFCFYFVFSKLKRIFGFDVQVVKTKSFALHHKKYLYLLVLKKCQKQCK